MDRAAGLLGDRGPDRPPFDAGVVAETARIHEQAGFDRVLIGYFSNAPDGFIIGAHAARGH
jgi:alkanesulfonate monooxygenase